MKIHSKEEIFGHINQFLSDNPDGVLEILGPTASGKTGLSIEIAKYIGNCEVISVDSRQVYRNCDISSAKITSEEMQGVPHWGLDLVDLDEEYSVYDFQRYAFEKISEIQSRGNVPILCGGTTLWLDAVSENYIFNPQKLEERDPNGDDYEKSNERGEPKWPVLKIGIHWDRAILYDRINKRASIQFEEGLLDETKQILKEYSLTDGNWCECKFDDRVVRIPNNPTKKRLARNVSSSFGYAEIGAYLSGVVTYEEALELNRRRNRNYAKRQLTWWRGREDVIWMEV